MNSCCAATGQATALSSLMPFTALTRRWSRAAMCSRVAASSIDSLRRGASALAVFFGEALVERLAHHAGIGFLRLLRGQRVGGGGEFVLQLAIVGPARGVDLALAECGLHGA